MAPDLLAEITQSYLDSIENELKIALARSNDFGNLRLYEMLAYHMGWESQASSRDQRGKRLRPLLVLLTCSAAGGDWHRALPGASAVELVHNFSLIHDDIEDHSPLRRGRPTVWKKWGIPQAINCGDAMFALAHLEAIRLSQTTSAAITLKAVELVQYTCLHLTEGQFLDLSYETKNDLTVEDYWHMVKGKTAALIAASTELGALAAFAEDQTCRLFHDFGNSLGLAFQAWDDWLGIWGNSSLTGKSSQSDLVTGKLTLPVVYGLSRSGQFAERWKRGNIQAKEVPEVTSLLEADGGKQFTEEQASQHINDALATLEQADPADPFNEALRNLATSLINRQV